MKILMYLLIYSISICSFGQEKKIQQIDSQDLDLFIESLYKKYEITFLEITPCLSFIINNRYQSNFILMPIDLSVDLRQQNLKPETPILQLAENKYIQSEYKNLGIFKQQERKSTFTISGNNNLNNRNTNNQRLKNTAYKDLYSTSGYYCPATGVPLFIR